MNIFKLFKWKLIPFWKTLWNAESEKAYWEINHDSEKEEVVLHYVPNEDYSKEDIRITLTYEKFEDLIEFIKMLDE